MPPHGQSISPVVNTLDASKYLGLSTSTLTKMRVTGAGPKFIKLSSRVLYRIADLDLWINEHVRRSTSDDGGCQ